MKKIKQNKTTKKKDGRQNHAPPQSNHLSGFKKGSGFFIFWMDALEQQSTAEFFY